MPDPVLPRAQAPANSGGPLSREYYDFLRLMLSSLLSVVDAESSDAAQIASILARLDALEAETDATINGLASVEVFGSLESGLVQIQLEGDTDTPGNTYYYGTGPDGTKGWSTVESALDVASGELTKTVGSDGVTTLGLADLADSGAGAFKLITRDAKGRLSGTVSGDTDDVPEGTTNLYYTDERVRDAMGATLVAGSNVTITVNDPGDTITIAATGGGASIPPEYIEGLRMVWISTTTVQVSTGSAYIQSSGTVLSLTSATNVGGGLSANTWYHLYLYNNAGTPSIEMSTTGPASPFSGYARSKSGDTTRRYVGSVRTNASSQIHNFQMSGNKVSYLEQTDLSPFRVLSGGAATIATPVVTTAVVPSTSHLVQIRLISDSTQASRYKNSSSSAGYVLGVPPAGQAFLEFPIDTSQQFQYFNAAAPGGAGVFCDVQGYVYER